MNISTFQLWNKLSTLRFMAQFMITFILLTLFAVRPGHAADQQAYHKMTLEGWKVFIDKSLVTSNDQRVYIALKILSSKLQQLKEILPQHQLAQLINIPIWISKNTGNDAEFYFFEQRIYRNDKNPEMMDGIEFHNINVFIKEIKHHPMLVLHELAHAYHKLNYDKIDKPVMRAYNNARQEKLYRQVSRFNSTEKQEAYALKNGFEYFAELTETYFGKNDYYPYTRSELQRYDPMGYKMIEAVWK